MNGGTGDLTLSIGDGTGKFTIGNVNAGIFPLFVALGDFNGDGKRDFAVVNEIGCNFSILLGNGGGTFQEAVNYSTGDCPQALTVADFNHDGKADLAVAH